MTGQPVPIPPPQIEARPAQKRYFPPPPQFPVHRPKMFARTPPVAFLVPLGALVALLALRLLFPSPGPLDLLTGVGAGLWLFCVLAYAVKLYRRPGSLIEDLRVLPNNAGLSAAPLGGMALAAILVQITPWLGMGLMAVCLAAQVIVAALSARHYGQASPQAREVSPVWQLNFASFALVGFAALPLGLGWLAQIGLYVTLAAAVLIWGLSMRQLITRIPPAPLRPLLGLHLVPSALAAALAAQLGLTTLATLCLAVTIVICIALIATLRWSLTSGFSPIWAALSLPASALALALVAHGLELLALIATLAACALALALGYKVLRMWPNGKLASRTNTSEA